MPGQAFLTGHFFILKDPWDEWLPRLIAAIMGPGITLPERPVPR